MATLMAATFTMANFRKFMFSCENWFLHAIHGLSNYDQISFNSRLNYVVMSFLQDDFDIIWTHNLRLTPKAIMGKF